MNVQQTSEMTKIPVEILLKMRSRENRSFKSGPPFHKKISSHGEPIYIYHKKEVQKWMKTRRCLVTAGDAAEIMGISRDELLNIWGLHGFNVKFGTYRGRLIVHNSKNFYVWLPRI